MYAPLRPSPPRARTTLCRGILALALLAGFVTLLRSSDMGLSLAVRPQSSGVMVRRVCPPGMRSSRRLNGQMVCRSASVEEKTEEKSSENFIDYIGRNKDLIQQFVNKETGSRPCPETMWNSKDMDIKSLRANPPADLDVEFPLYVKPGDLSLPQDAKPEDFAAQKGKVRELLLKHGALVFRGFDFTKSMEGYHDPLEGTFLRKNADKEIKFTFNQNPTHYVGMHTECTHTLGPVSGAFWCGTPASMGGEFTLLDGRKMFYDLDQDVLQRFYDKDVRIKVVGLPAGPLANVLPRDLMAKAFEGLASNMPGPTADLMSKYELDFHVNRHPVTGEPLWFCNIHNHARYLTDRRPNSLVEIARADVYFGDLTTIPGKDVQHIDDITRKNLHKCKMEPGDIVLLDNYRVLHGRENFTDIAPNARKHCVTWFAN
ncbi:hypothetical protein AAMO2058_001300800 [Amorphochlora amoebiformis]